MHSVVVTDRLDPASVAQVQQLVIDAERVDGYRPISDQAWLDLSNGTTSPSVRVTVTLDDGTIIAYAQATDIGVEWTLEIVVRPDFRIELSPIATRLLAEVTAAIHTHGGGSLAWTVFGPNPQHDLIASSFGLVASRRLLQMRRALPTNLPFDIDTRPFDPERDVDAWVRVNARAFAWNPEQGTWTAASLRMRMLEPWFDADGFLIHERDGRMAGFCWTKVHEASTPPLGEIYVIAVDPDFHGLGLGRELTLAGLESLAERGLRTGMLFVDADNVSAVRLYDKLGFVLSRTDCLYTTAIA